MPITATHIAYYIICKRKLWLFSNNIQMEHTSDIVYEGKLISETTYQQRAQKYTELELDGVKIDFFDAKNKVVHEVKKSSKMESAHEWQVKYYLLVLERNGISGSTAVLEYPKLREKKEVLLNDADKLWLENAEKEIKELAAAEKCPPVINKPLCKKCSYFDFCYSDE
jgi:CRISPR-associated exonuclease Cas4